MAREAENKLSVALRTLLSFVLFLLIVIVSVSVCVKTVVVNKSVIESRFTDFSYVTSVKESIGDYITDIYIQNGLDTSGIDDITEYDTVSEAIKAYVDYNIGVQGGYNEDTYTLSVDQICDALKTDLNEQLKEKKLDSNEDTVEDIVSHVRNYILNEVEIGYSGIRNLLNISSVASIAIMCVGLFFAIATGLILFFIGSVRYRSIRAMAISFYSAGVFELLMSLISVIIFKFKHIDIFPVYLKDAVMGHIYSCIGSIAVAGCVSLMAALVITVAVWRKKRGK